MDPMGLILYDTSNTPAKLNSEFTPESHDAWKTIRLPVGEDKLLNFELGIHTVQLLISDPLITKRAVT